MSAFISLGVRAIIRQNLAIMLVDYIVDQAIFERKRRK